MKRQLIMRVFYIDIEGLTRQQAEQQLYILMKEYKPEETLPQDILDQYYVNDIWLPIRGQSRVEIIYPNNMNFDKLSTESIDKIIEKLTFIKNEKLDIDPYGEENWDR